MGMVTWAASPGSGSFVPLGTTVPSLQITGEDGRMCSEFGVT